MLRRSKIQNRIVVDWPVIMAARQQRARDPRLKKFYGAAAIDPKTPLEQADFVALDFETTGLNPVIDDIISIGLVPFTLKRVQCNGAAQWLVNPRGNLDEDSIVIHGITHSDINGAPDLWGILENLLSALTGKIIVVHYHPIERQFLDTALMDRLGEGIQFPVIDTMAIEASIQRRSNGNWWKRLQGKSPLSVRLADSRMRYGLPRYSSHHALTDALATAELLQAQVAHHYSARTPLAELLI